MYAALILLALTGASTEPDLAARAHAVLKARCFECHGAEKQRGDLRLDSLETALHGGESHEAAFVAGDADNSLLVYLVESNDKSERMPSKRDPLPPEEIAVLRAWIDAGAHWPTPDALRALAAQHWSFVPPQRPAPPTVERAGAVRNDLDRFLVRAIEQAGLNPAPEADAHTLIRRAYLELLGLPPAPAEVDAFIKDLRPDAYERLVDALLASPHYGERQARRWLDIARYADTNGYEKDRPRSIWPYRDWVINAFNDNLPYDEFVIEQIAGDLLPGASESQRVATGFSRNSMFNEEGGIDAAEDWFKRTVDRTNVAGAAFLGLTVSCAQCHDHKYDPISQREYYGMFAFFNNAGEDTLRLRDAGIEADQARIRDEIEQAENDLIARANNDHSIRAGFDVWLSETRPLASGWSVLRPASFVAASSTTLELLPDDSILATGDIPNDDVYTLEVDLPAGWQGQAKPSLALNGPITAIRLEALPHDSLPGGGPGRGVILADGDFLLTSIDIYAEDGARIAIASATQDFAAKDNEAAKSLDDRRDTGWSVKGATGKPHAAVFTLARPLPPDAGRLRIVLTQDYIHQHVIGRFRISATSRESAIASGVPADIEAALLRDDGASRDELFVHYCLEIAPGLADERARIATLRGSMPNRPTTLVMTPRDPPRDTRLYHRGEFLNPRETVTPAVPAVLPPLPDAAPPDRLSFARWLVSRGNPLTARVAMNRLWQDVFGRGLVTTPDDFGTRGDPPSNPELLDWLAVEFMDSGWDMKHMHRLMVTSAAFRRSSAVTPDLLEADPQNTLLARGPRFRLSAEAIRDIALAAAGLLNPEIGGPSVFPPQPAGINELAFDSGAWKTSTGPGRYRRGLYTYMKRTAPYAAAITFDAPSGEESCTRRERTTTPLQALALLNDRVFIEAARAMAHRVLAPGRSEEDTVALAFELCLARPPDGVESARIKEYFDAIRSQFESDPARAREIAGPLGALYPTKQLPELAAWTLVCRVILNLDETITQG